MLYMWLIVVVANAFASGLACGDERYGSAVAGMAVSLFACIEVVDCFKRRERK